MENNTKTLINLVEDTTKIIALLAIYILLTGFFQLFIYYELFNINITSYISTSEIILLSFSNLILILYFIGAVLALHLTYHFKIKPKDPDKAKASSNLIWYEVFLLVIILISAGIFAYIKKDDEYFYWMIFLLLMVATICINIVFLNKLLLGLKNGMRYTSKIFFGGITMAFITAFTILFADGIKIINIKFRKTFPQKISFQLKDGRMIAPKDSLYYLGKTENYLFIWNKNDDSTTIYPTSEIVKFVQ